MVSVQWYPLLFGLLLSFETCLSIPLSTPVSNLDGSPVADSLTSSFALHETDKVFRGDASQKHSASPLPFELQSETPSLVSVPSSGHTPDEMRLTKQTIRMEAGLKLINCGGGASNTMQSDEKMYFGNTKTYTTNKSVGITKKQNNLWRKDAEEAMKSHRFAQAGSFKYKIQVDGPHFVTLYFAETYQPMMGDGRRQFHVLYNNRKFHDEQNSTIVDVFGSMGSLQTLGLQTDRAVKPADGYIEITLQRIADRNNPMISAILLRPENSS